ncbi:MAG: acyl-CoA dehydrogenase family protein [Burkholderiaceae bacterium]
MSDTAPESAIEALIERGSKAIAADGRGLNYWRIDESLQHLLRLHVAPEVFEHFAPHLDTLGEAAGGWLDELASVADRNPPVLRPRDRFGRDTNDVDYHPAYKQMERFAFGQLGLAAMSHKPGLFGWSAPVPPVIKYAFTYLFSQAEFGLLCPINGTDAAAQMIRRHGDERLQQRMQGMLSQDMNELAKVGHFMTEKHGGSDLGGIETRAERDGEHWRLYGEKWFCSAIDADFILVLARPDGAAAGSRGLGMFVVPRLLDGGAPNRYRIIRLKDKLGTRSMATGEVVFDGAQAYPVGELSDGIRIATVPINYSRLSHGVRAAGMMRRCLNEAVEAARSRRAFGRTVADHPLMKRSLAKILVPTEQALSVSLFVASELTLADAGDADASRRLRIATALLKFRACRDNAVVATASMEVRGGSGFIEEWVNARLVRDAQTGLLWEGTSNINALDIVNRAVRKNRAHEALAAYLRMLLETPGIPAGLAADLSSEIERVTADIEEIAASPELEHLCRSVSSRFYHVLSAVLMAWEGARCAAAGRGARRLLLAWLVLMHRVRRLDPLDSALRARESAVVEALLGDAGPIPLAEVDRMIRS